MESGLILANFWVRHPYAIPFTLKLHSVYGAVGPEIVLKLEKTGPNILKWALF